MGKKDMELHPKVRDAVAESDIVHCVFECKPEWAGTAEFVQHYAYTAEQSANTILVVVKANPPKFAACVVLATTWLDVNRKVCELLQVKRASFARMDDASRVSGMEFGGITAIGLPTNIPLYVDAAVLKQREVVMGGGNRTSKLVLDPRELKKLPNVQIVEGLAHPK